MRAVFDTNIVLSALIFGRRLAWLRESWANGSIVPIVCGPTTDELLRVLAYPKFRLDPPDRAALIADYLPHAETIQLPSPAPELPVACRDRDDAIFLVLAMLAGVPLVSGDADVTSLRGAVPVEVLSAADLRARVPE